MATKRLCYFVRDVLLTSVPTGLTHQLAATTSSRRGPGRRTKIENDLAACRKASSWGSSKGELEQEPQGFGGQAIKGIRWMPWHQEAMKDVAKLR